MLGSEAERRPSSRSDSLSEYLHHGIRHGWWLTFGVGAGGLGLCSVAGAHVLAMRSWMWFAIALAAFSVVQYYAFRDIRRERDAVFGASSSERVSVFAIAAARGDVPAPLAAPVAYQLRALRQVLSFFDAEHHHEVDAPEIDSVLKRLERDGVILPYEPLSIYDCKEGIEHLLETGELVSVPARRGFSYVLSAQPPPVS
jgi:hypothetical protein